jgi:LmbE family N-acetylglucosaminyl deacetylase
MDTLTSPVLVVSPHLDDGVFSCGQLLAHHPGSWVVTVFAGEPANGAVITSWDAACGFGNAAQAMQARRAEDAAATSMVSARARWLDFLDSQYGATPGVEAVSDALGALMRALAPSTVCFPAGLFHSDHALVHDAVLALLRREPTRDWVMYEDALYRRQPGLLQTRLDRLRSQSIVVTPLRPPLPGDASWAVKSAALACYGSQLRALRSVAAGHEDALATEGYWRVAVQP